MSDQQQTVIICDPHVHIYDCFDLGAILDSAFANFSAAAQANDVAQFSAVIMLSETWTDNRFEQLSAAAEAGDTLDTNWSFAKTDEAESLLATRDDGSRVLIIAGRQIVTLENLEIHALATRFKCPDGEPAANIIAQANEAESLVVAPWGFGKWWGKRGKLLNGLMDQWSTEQLLLGDNSGRPWFLPKPEQFSRAITEHRRILPGSDPLPFPGEEKRVGSVGCMLSCHLDLKKPAAGIRALLHGDAIDTTTYMQTERLLPFFRNQIGMQLRKKSS